MTVMNIDCIEGMRLFPDAYFDSIVTDPPYELGFMGKTWDASGIANNVEMWREALRVLKPGGHLLAFSGSRTYHRMVCAIEDAGFEIRDQIMWVYGSGFPKSLDVSKAIDKARDDSAEGLAVGAWLKAQREIRGFKQKDVAALWPSVTGGLTGCVANWETLGKVPKWDQWLQLKAFIGFGDDMDTEVWRLNGRKGTPGEAWQNAAILGEHEGVTPGFVGMRFDAMDNTIREPSDAARQWQGWGTALKPAHEPIVVARKPLIGTVAANVLAHGTGALNIDECRIEGQDVPAGRSRHGGGLMEGSSFQMPDSVSSMPAGRWPANLIHDGSDEVLEAFPQAPGQLADASTSDTQRAGQNVYGAMRRGRGAESSANSENTGDVGFILKPGTRRLDTGSAARFFRTCESRYDDDLWQDLNLPSSDAAIADANLHLQRQAVFSALAVAAKKALPAVLLWDVSLSTEPITAATPTQLRRLETALTQTIQSIDCAYWLAPERARLSLSLNPVQSAVLPTPTDTTTITLSHWLSDGSAEPVTFSITPTNWAAGAKDCAPSWAAEGARFKYCAKASKADRGADNHHPTVKPTELMRYLCRLVTPPGGTVLDPFTGSGSTGKAARLEGFGFIGFELDPDYVAIATARISNAA